MLEMLNVYKSYYKNENVGIRAILKKKNVIKKEVIKGVNIKIPKGKIVGLLGVNGAGKTTIIKMLSTLLSVDNGKIFMNGVDIEKNEVQVKEKINVIMGGERNLYWRLTGKENLDYFASLYGIDKKTRNERIDNVLQVVKLNDSKDIPVEQYSKGMKQRLQIARGLINDPEYILLDEPTLGLDIVMAKDLRHYIKKMCNDLNKGVLLTSHYLQEVEELCDYIYILDKGKILKEGTPEEIVENVNLNSTLKVEFKRHCHDIVKTLNALSEKNIIVWNNNTLEIKAKKSLIEKLVSEISTRYVDNLLSINIIKPTLEESLMEIWDERD